MKPLPWVKKTSQFVKTILPLSTSFSTLCIFCFSLLSLQVGTIGMGPCKPSHNPQKPRSSQNLGHLHLIYTRKDQASFRNLRLKHAPHLRSGTFQKQQNANQKVYLLGQKVFSQKQRNPIFIARLLSLPSLQFLSEHQYFSFFKRKHRDKNLYQ